VDGLGRLAVLGPGEARAVAIEYTAPSGPGEAKEQATWRVGRCPDADTCGLALVVQGLPDHEAPQLLVLPGGVHFGPTPVGAEVERSVRLLSQGVRPLHLSGLRHRAHRRLPEHPRRVRPVLKMHENKSGLLIRRSGRR
jgi:hypothetical protein